MASTNLEACWWANSEIGRQLSMDTKQQIPSLLRVQLFNTRSWEFDLSCTVHVSVEAS